MALCPLNIKHKEESTNDYLAGTHQVRTNLYHS
jgi:hypothetical protein